MKPTDRPPFSPAQQGFRWTHGALWLLYLWLLKTNFELLRDAASSSGVTLLPAIVLSWIAVLIAIHCLPFWLDGANRSVLFRLALALSALPSCALGVWMLWHYGVFLLVGLMTLFQRPFELISLTLFGERLLVLLASVGSFAAYAWFSLRVLRVLLSGEAVVTVDHVLDQYAPESGRSSRPPPDPPESMSRRHPGGVAGGASREPCSGYQASFARSFVGPPRPPEMPGKQRYQCRPRELQPERDGTYNYVGPPVLGNLGFARNKAPAVGERCRAIGWPAFEWVLRTQPSLPELAMALQALPWLAGAIDSADADEARDWISRLADHPGQFDQPVPYRDAADRVDDITIRIAEVAFQALIDWDDERRRFLAPPDAAENRPA